MKIPIVKTILVRESVLEQKLGSPDVAIAIARQLCGNSPQEECWLICLDAKLTPLNITLVSRGTTNSSIVVPTDVYRPAILSNARGVVIIHNHPSGDARPSKEDHALTKRILHAGKILGIKLTDHIIIGAPDDNNNCNSYSFRNSGFFDDKDNLEE